MASGVRGTMPPKLSDDHLCGAMEISGAGIVANPAQYFKTSSMGASASASTDVETLHKSPKEGE